MMDRISICEGLAKWNEIEPFIKRMVTGDEKLVTYDNIVRKRSWSKHGEEAQTVAKPGLTFRKILLCIWWDWKGFIYYELLPAFGDGPHNFENRSGYEGDFSAGTSPSPFHISQTRKHLNLAKDLPCIRKLCKAGLQRYKVRTHDTPAKSPLP
ncbi:mariner transposase [Trichonephila clavipes]|uniref:Mariner transposase n=1 Tax=Trichonephila clavipes TaxID=2585209 RepID=A0A8X6SYQ4_TRICX|nr:mariner transposase [Trichonephila clavipes]